MIDKYIKSFSANLDGLREFAELIKPFLDENEKRTFEEHLPALKPLELAYKSAMLDPSDPERTKLLEELHQIFSGEIIVKRNEDDKGISVTFNKSDGKALDEAFRNIQRATSQKTLLYYSSLITLLSSVEWFFSQILHYYFDKFPEAAGIEDKSLTLSELKSFGNVTDAQNYLIDSKVEEILRGSFEDWVKILKTKAKLSIGYIDKVLDPMVEVYQRRNILVHNGGVVNSIYMAKVKPELRQSLKIGDVIEVSPSYLENAICMLELNFVLIAAELWKNLEPMAELRADVLLDIAFDHLMKERNSVCEGMSLFLLNDKKVPEVNRLIGQVNYWLSLKYSGRFDDIKNEITGSDFSAKDPIFRLAKYCLLDDYEKVFNLLPEMLSKKELAYSRLDTWPLFRDVRKQQQYLDFKKAHEKEFSSID